MVNDLDRTIREIRAVIFELQPPGPAEPLRRRLLNAVREARKAQKLEIVGIAVDFRDDVLAYVKERPIHYPLLIGEEDGLEALKSVGMTAAFPFTLFADSKQRILALKVGELHQDELDLILDQIHTPGGGVPRRMAWISGKVGLPSARSSPTFLPITAASPL